MDSLSDVMDGIAQFGYKPEDVVLVRIGAEDTRLRWTAFHDLLINQTNTSQTDTDMSRLTLIFKDGSSMWNYERKSESVWEFAKPFQQLRTLHRIQRNVCKIQPE